MRAFNGTSSEFNVYLAEPMLARIMITVRTTPGQIPEFDVPELEARLAAASRRWEDDLKDALIEACGEAWGTHLFRLYGGAFAAGYREDFEARAAVPDIELMAKLTIGKTGGGTAHAAPVRPAMITAPQQYSPNRRFAA